MHKFFSRGKNFIKQNESASFYEQTKNNQHIFIFSVLGRTSSTALQRILNSSNQICISGEPKGIVDGQLKLISKLEERQKKFVSSSNERLKASFKANKHNLPYPHALNIESTVFLIKASISNLLRSAMINVERYGFKDIELKKICTIKYLKSIFPNCVFIFLFRDPVEQFRSVKEKCWWDYSKDLNLFLKKYQELATKYLKINLTENNTYFIENKILYDKQNLSKFLQLLNLSKFDETLINDSIFSTQKKKISEKKLMKISNSRAYKSYLNMVAESNKFIKSL